MKEFMNVVSVKLLNTSDSYSFNADEVSITPTTDDSDSGQVYNCDKDYVIDRPDDDVLKTFSYPRNSIVTLKDTEGKTYKFGTDDIPAQVIIVPYLQKSTLKVTCKMLTQPLL